jgi:hydroxyproline O-arabinosyltransferase
MNWQSRVMYATYLAVVAQDPTGPLARGAFTRVLHRSTPDELMEEIPTLRFTPVHVNCDTYCSFPVADRSPALVEWMATEDAGRCSHIMLVETDYLWVKSLSADLLPSDGTALAFPYSYIVPTYPTVAPYSAKYYSGPVGDIPPTGNAPVLLTRSDFGKLVPEWARIVAEIEEDEVAVERLGWVRDMYAWSFAAVRTGIKHHMPMPPLNELMVQPPADTELGKAALLHYTWGPVIYNSSDALIWEFDKRSYCGGQYAIGPRLLEKIPEPPAWQQGLHLQSFFAIGNAITPSGLELMRLFVHTFNQAVEALPELPKGWSDRAAAEAAAKPSPESQVLADKVQAEIAAREEEKKKTQQGRKD